jgi:hypothetical protein
MSVSSYLSSRFPVMQVAWAATTLIWMTFMGMSLLPEGYAWGADNETCWRGLDDAWSGSPKPTTASWATASA